MLAFVLSEAKRRNRKQIFHINLMFKTKAWQARA